MRDLSGWLTLAPPEVVTRDEVRVAVGRLCDVAPTMASPVGHGVNHAFSSSTGRFRFVESLWTGESGEGGPVQGIDLLAAQNRPDAWEWFNLAGPAEDFPCPTSTG